MAGAADREQEAPGDRDGDLQPLAFEQIEICPECEQDVEVTFQSESIYDKEQVGEEELTATVICPHCYFEWEASYEGWTAGSDAG